MTALLKPDLPAEIRNEIARLKGAGFHPLPLGGGHDGKAPLIRKWTAPRLSLAQVLAPMHRAGSAAYGLRLDGLAVVDCDEDSADLVEALEARFGPCPVHVKTPRGRHLYYRAGGSVPNLRGEGLPVDIKTGGRSYVVGPMSLRRDGGFYAPSKGILGHDPLPVLRITETPTTRPIQEGARHAAMVKEAIAMVELVASPEELTARLVSLRDALCENPETMAETELRDISKWAWGQLLKGEIFHGRDSGFRINRLALDALRGKPGGSDAIALFVTLTDLHGHSPGKRFVLDHKAMRAAGLTDLSEKAFRAARRALESAGLLHMVGKHWAGAHGQIFTLARLRPTMAEADNVQRLHDAAHPRGGKSRGRV